MLFRSSILDSTVWREDRSVVVVWITMLLMANTEGVVTSSIPGLADRARVSIDELEGALAILEAEDKYSSDGGSGVRVVRLPDGGGFLLTSYRRYYEKQTAWQKKKAEYNRKAYAKRKADDDAEAEPDAADIPFDDADWDDQ